MTANPLQVAAADTVYDFMTALNDHIAARVKYDRDGPRYAGENPPAQDDVSAAFTAAVLATVRAALISG